MRPSVPCTQDICSFVDLVGRLLEILSLIIPLIFALTLLVIIWKVVNLWIINAGDTTKVDEGKKVALIGVIVLVIMSGLWGIIALLHASLFG